MKAISILLKIIKFTILYIPLKNLSIICSIHVDNTMFSTSIVEIKDKFFKVKVENHMHDYPYGKSNVFEALDIFLENYKI